ncbi:uncharacterized protein L969DRAFT_16165 [Mixia osmundae IAM 14324]|uniref:HhH-GPD domain-containing protein n=1 Tax=Mixia osmundae (strain CBS 9802 / IAM 14324 / JCM 22182 / KY 12970) TaxID=764103 RepID=G7E5D5_MIXOS|nr:uncharacterized protein L969DRAFT_16165 [Mixia osmundae IAM 14324]KEI40803.1 hypothetical protein L969DRAFT_16165 [Mixia osmundae IAM 14324]GAA98045.1 hypothetical protein E5Q_04726 [Mixia osmundae IAM 14324]
MPPKKSGATKRKTDNADAAPNGKKSKTSSRSSARTNAPSSDPVKTLNFLLSDKALDLATPPEEKEDISKQDGAAYKTYRTPDLSPFEELVCASLLSKPIDHRLGSRSIRTLLNAPFSFNTPGQIVEAGEDKLRESLDTARTQHRQKTAAQLLEIATVIKDKYAKDGSDDSLEGLRKAADSKPEEIKKLLKEIKGIGEGGVNILFRRLQIHFEELYPTADDRALSAASTLFGLPSEPDKLREVIKTNINDLDTSDIKGSGDLLERKVFARVLDRAIGIEIEGKGDEAKECI